MGLLYPNYDDPRWDDQGVYIPLFTPEQRRKDFKCMLAEIWRFLSLPEPTPIQNDIADWLSMGPKRSGTEAFRGVGKSWITSGLALWFLDSDPQLKILVVSASKDRSDAFSIFTKRLIEEAPFLEHLRPRDKQRTSNVQFDVGPARPAHAPSVKSVGIFGQLTGSRANIIIADDIEVPKNSYTQTMRDRLSEAVKEFDAVLSPGQTNRIIYLGTPQCEMSIYNQLPNRGFEFRIWPAKYPNAALVNYYGGRLAPYIVSQMVATGAKIGDPTEPSRFDEVDLAQREMSYGRTGFALQFMLDTRMSDALKYPLKLSDLIISDVHPEMAPATIYYGSGQDQLISAQDLPMVGLSGDRLYRPFKVDNDLRPYQGAVMFIDPSGRGTDETGYAVVKMCHGNLYVPAASGLQGGFDKPTLTKLAGIAKEFAVTEIIIESNFGDGMYMELFKPVLNKIYPCTVNEVRASSQKERRIIDTLEPVMNQHRLVVDPKVVRTDARETDDTAFMLFWQMTRLTAERGALGHDDRLDALCGAVAYWTEKMGAEQEDAKTNWTADELKASLDDFLGHVMGIKTGGNKKGNRWIHC